MVARLNDSLYPGTHPLHADGGDTPTTNGGNIQAVTNPLFSDQDAHNINGTISLCSNNAYGVNNSNSPNDPISLHSNNAYGLSEEAEYEEVK